MVSYLSYQTRSYQFMIQSYFLHRQPLASHNTCLLEIGDFRPGVAVLLQDLRAVLCELWWRAPCAALRSAELDRCPEALVPIEFGDHFPMHRVRCRRGLIHRKHRTGRHTVPDQPQRQLIAVLVRKSLRERLRKSGTVDVAFPVIGEPRIVGHVRPADELAEFAKLSIVAAGDEDFAGTSRKLVVRYQVRMRIACPRGPFAVEEEIGGMRMQQGHAAVVQRHVEELTVA